MSMSDKILILVVDMQTEVEEESYGGKLWASERAQQQFGDGGWC